MEAFYTTLSSPASASVLNFQGSELPRRKLCKKSSHTILASPTLPKPFFQIYGRSQTLLYRSTRLSSGAHRATISAEAGRQNWDFGRFVKTLFFFNGFPYPAKFFDFLVEKQSDPSPSEVVNTMGTSDIVLVAGATGGVGRRVVDILQKKGIPVRVLVRNEEKAGMMLGSDVDLIWRKEMMFISADFPGHWRHYKR